VLAMSGWSFGFVAVVLLVRGQLVLLEPQGPMIDDDGTAHIPEPELHDLKEKAEKVLENTLTSTQELLEKEGTQELLDEVEERKIWVQINKDAIEKVIPDTLSTVMAEEWEEDRGINCTKEAGHASSKCESAHVLVSKFAEKAVLVDKLREENPKMSMRLMRSDALEDVEDEACIKRKQGCNDVDQSFPPVDGWCNNLQHPEWGSQNMPYRRMKGRVYYRDRLKRPYSEQDGYPSVRELSQKLMTHRDGSPEEDTSASVLFALFGQFLAHDITQASFSDGHEKCKDSEPEQASVFCRKMVRTEADTHDNLFFHSSFITNPHKCKKLDTPIRSEQINGHPSYLILTTLYGRVEDDLRLLRTNFNDGKMDLENCGDGRCPATPILLAYHKLFLHEHNRIVDGLKAAGLRDTNGNTLFQVARAINIAQYQAIVFEEYLKLLLPIEIYNLYELECRDIISSYIDTIDAGLYNSFTTAAFRFGHSMIPEEAIKNGPSKHSIQDTLLKATDSVNDGNFISFLLGASETPCHKVDRHVTNHMRGHDNTKFIGGRDIAAMNLARGRDHGLQPYYILRIWFSEILGGGDIMKDIEPADREILQELYKDAIFPGGSEEHLGEGLTDLWLGGLMEKHRTTGKVGPLFAAIIGFQFNHLKFGDRYFFSHSSDKGGKGLLPDLRRMVSKRKLSDLICDNGNGLEEVKSNPFEFTSNSVPCSERQRLDFDLIARTFNEKGTLYV